MAYQPGEVGRAMQAINEALFQISKDVAAQTKYLCAISLIMSMHVMRHMNKKDQDELQKELKKVVKDE